MNYPLVKEVKRGYRVYPSESIKAFDLGLGNLKNLFELLKGLDAFQYNNIKIRAYELPNEHFKFAFVFNLKPNEIIVLIEQIELLLK